MDERKFFPKQERLFLRKDIDRLFDAGKSFISFPLRIVYLPKSEDHVTKSGVSVLINVPKKRIRHAVKRNRIKRLIRESFRLNKSLTSSYCMQKGEQLHIAFMYISNEMKEYTDIEKAVRKALIHIGSLPPAPSNRGGEEQPPPDPLQ